MYVYARHHNPRPRDCSTSGFTLIELLIVVVILGVLSAVVVFALGGVNAQAAVSACKTDARSVETAVAGVRSAVWRYRAHEHR